MVSAPVVLFVMAGLVPAIHVLLVAIVKKDVDARHKAGHDDYCVAASSRFIATPSHQPA
jgi:hypothetical protein